jgi:hypothetical protein
MNKKLIVSVWCICMMTIGSIPVMAISDFPSLNQELSSTNEIIDLTNNSSISGIPEVTANEFISLDPELPLAQETAALINDSSLGDYFVTIIGPISKLFTQVELINGSESQMQLIQRNLDRKLLRFSLILRNIPVFVENLSFSVEFIRDVRNRSRFSYITANGTTIYDGNGTYQNLTNISYIRNEIHSVTIENLTGLFVFIRIRLINIRAPFLEKVFQPARFAFVGFCQNITISTTV